MGEDTVVASKKLLGGDLIQEEDEEGECSEDMFQASSSKEVAHAAFLACKAQYAFQRNWYPDPIAGLFSYQTWNGMDGFWQNGLAIETLANAMHYGNHTRYFSVLKSSLREVSSLELAYSPEPSFDDMAWYGLAFARVHELYGLNGFLRVSKDIFNWCWTNGWDMSGQCGGGMWFDGGMNAKATITNVQMFQLGMKLARLSSSKRDQDTFRDRATKVWQFINNTGILDYTNYKVYDGISLDSCKVEDKQTTFTYTAGTLAGGLVEEYKLKKDAELLQLAVNVSNSVLQYITKDGVLTENCDPDDSCNLDARAFKGIFTRNLRYLIDVSPANQEEASYKKFLNRNVAALTTNASCTPSQTKDCHIVYLDGPPAYNKTGPVYGAAWNLHMKEARPMAHNSALDLLNSAVFGGTAKCTGKSCSFDPPNPPPHHLTCKDNPCPTGQDCCSFVQSYTCCAVGQKCLAGICT